RGSIMGNMKVDAQRKTPDPAVRSEFTLDEFDNNWVGRLAFAIFRWRLPLLILGILATLFFIYSASKLQLSSGFNKMIPANHEYMQTFFDYSDVFGGA